MMIRQRFAIKLHHIFPLIISILFLQNPAFGKTPERIVSLSGSITEVLDAIGLGERIVGVDVTSDFPAYIDRIPKVSSNRTFTAEAIASFRPDLVLGLEGELSPTLQNQLKRLKIPLVLIKQEYSVQGVENMIRTIALAVNRSNAGTQLSSRISQRLSQFADTSVPSKKVMFIYARGAGHMSVSGSGTAVDAVIRLAGHRNALQGFSGYKTYNTEALVAANPDVILLFDFGMSSLGGINGVMSMPGIRLTNAGKNRKIVTLNAGMLNNFSVRLPDAVAALRKASK